MLIYTLQNLSQMLIFNSTFTFPHKKNLTPTHTRQKFLLRTKVPMKNTNLTALFGALCTTFLVLLAVISPAVAERDFKVGDSEGWRVPRKNKTAMYNQWAGRNRFQVGDSLSFEYKNDSVLVVDKFGYYHCNTSKPISAFNNGKTVFIKLDRPGLFYFISGNSNHCKNGLRLIVDVMTPHQISHSPPTIALPPATYWEMSPSPSPLPSSGLLVSVSLVSVSMALVTTILTLI